jgi:phage terminase large subunit GpA-like protein
VSRFVSLSESAAAFLWGLKDRIKLRDFRNNHEAEPWVNYTHEKQEDAILSLRDERSRGMVPSYNRVCSMVAGIDSQDDGFFYEIRAWGYGLIQDSWQIREGFVTSLDALKQVLWEDEYWDADGRQYLVAAAVIDAMGHRTAEVYDFCRLNPGRIIPSKGERTMRQPHAWSRIDNYPGTNKPIPGGLSLIRVNTTHYKNQLAAMLEIPFADPGSWKYHADTTSDWAIQMTAEYLGDDGFWAVKASRPNHAWDCSVLTLCAADLIGLRFRPRPEQRQNTPGPRIAPPPSGGWVKRTGSWLNR